MYSVSYGFRVRPILDVVTTDFIFVIYQCKANIINYKYITRGTHQLSLIFELLPFKKYYSVLAGTAVKIMSHPTNSA